MFLPMRKIQWCHPPFLPPSILSISSIRTILSWSRSQWILRSTLDGTPVHCRSIHTQTHTLRGHLIPENPHRPKENIVEICGILHIARSWALDRTNNLEALRKKFSNEQIKYSANPSFFYTWGVPKPFEQNDPKRIPYIIIFHNPNPWPQNTFIPHLYFRIYQFIFGIQHVRVHFLSFCFSTESESLNFVKEIAEVDGGRNFYCWTLTAVQKAEKG